MATLKIIVSIGRLGLYIWHFGKQVLIRLTKEQPDDTRSGLSQHFQPEVLVAKYLGR
jgi:hypothetical protein